MRLLVILNVLIHLLFSKLLESFIPNYPFIIRISNFSFSPIVLKFNTLK